MPKEEKDGWDKASIVIKGFLATAVTVTLGILGYSSELRQNENNRNLAKIAEKNRIAQVQVQTMNNREIAATQMRVQMFKTLMERYFDSENNIAAKITILELVGLNFQNNLYLKPLFQKLNEELFNDSKSKEELRKIGKEMNRFEVDNILGSGGSVYRLELNTTDNITHRMLYFHLLDITEDYIRISTNKEDVDGFKVTFFDMPFMDNSTLGEYTYSISLSNIDLKNKKVIIKLVEFPRYYHSTRNKLYLDSKIADMTKIDMTE